MGSGAALAFLLMLGALHAGVAAAGPQYAGKALGALSELHHGVRGRVFAVDSRTLYLQDFHYDGEGPAAYFYVGTSGRPSAAGGVRLRDERGGAGPLRRYRGEGVTLALPDPHTLRDLRWFAIWCDEYSVNFGDVAIPKDLEYPKPVRVGALRGVHGVSSDPIVVVDAQTLLVPNFSYDGEAPDAKFWVGRGDKPSPQGIRIPDENGKEAPLRKYDKKTIVLTLPGELTVFDIGHFAVWCEAFTVNFGHVPLPPAQLTNVPPSLKMLGVSPQSRNRALAESTGSSGASVNAVSRSGQRLSSLPATTYRPHLRAGPRPASTQPHAAALRRRADQATPVQAQLLQPDQDRTLQNSQDLFDRQLQYQQYQYQNNQLSQYQQNPQLYQQHQLEQQNLQYQQQLQQQQQLQRQQQQFQQVQQQQFLQQQPAFQSQNLNYQQLSHEELLLRQRLLDEQRRLYELQLQELQYRNALQQGPERYRFIDARRQRETEGEEGAVKERASEVTIQRSVDLDLDAGSGSQ